MLLCYSYFKLMSLNKQKSYDRQRPPSLEEHATNPEASDGEAGLSRRRFIELGLRTLTAAAVRLPYEAPLTASNPDKDNDRPGSLEKVAHDTAWLVGRIASRRVAAVVVDVVLPPSEAVPYAVYDSRLTSRPVDAGSCDVSEQPPIPPAED
jgi:hypothetical protein